MKQLIIRRLKSSLLVFVGVFLIFLIGKFALHEATSPKSVLEKALNAFNGVVPIFVFTFFMSNLRLTGLNALPLSRYQIAALRLVGPFTLILFSLILNAAAWLTVDWNPFVQTETRIAFAPFIILITALVIAAEDLSNQLKWAFWVPFSVWIFVMFNLDQAYLQNFFSDVTVAGILLSLAIAACYSTLISYTKRKNVVESHSRLSLGGR